MPLQQHTWMRFVSLLHADYPTDIVGIPHFQL